VSAVTARSIDLRLDGRSVAVAPGTTVAAALWDAGIVAFRTSTSGEPRGPACGMGTCFECRVTIDGVAHRRACLVTCSPGMVVETGGAAAQGFPSGPGSPGDEGAAAQRSPSGPGAMREDGAGSPGRPSGPGGVGESGAAAQRFSSGPGSPGDGGGGAEAPGFPDSTVRVDVAVVGAGPAGLAAACAAAEAGASVLLLDEAAAPGGQVWRRASVGAGSAAGQESAGLAAARPSRLARRWMRRCEASGACLVSGASVLDVAPGPTLLADQAGRALRVEARRLVIATGARERFLPFPGWTLPNVMGVGGAQALLKSGASFRGRRVVVAGSGPLLLPVAASLARAGARIAIVAEQAPAAAVARFAAALWRRPRRLIQAARYRAAFWRAPYRCGVWVSAALGGARPPSSGEVSLGAGVRRPAAAQDSLAVRETVLTDGFRTWSEECDLLACAYGLVPNLELARLLGCALTGGDPRVVRVDARQQTSVAGVYCAGEPTGIGGLEPALLSGRIAGMAAAGIAPETPLLRSLQRRRDHERGFAAALRRAFQPRSELLRLATSATIVCRCEDVPLGKIDPAWSARQAKLYTRAGMGPCQGRVCGAALELLLGWDQADTIRPPLAPVALATLAELAGGELTAEATATDPCSDA
jgi:NADPH-dependent 2,4-dienoyl-CoA reductase/sulfur reductase-like enzyme